MKKKEKIDSISINSSQSIKEALSQMDTADKKLLLVFKQGKFKSILSIGDIQRAILKEKPLSEKIESILRKNIKLASSSDSFSVIKKTMIAEKIECMPVVNEKKELVNIHFWEDIFEDSQKIEKPTLNVPVVIMAGGKGTRLKPITNIIPKPLIPIGSKTIVEHIIDRFIVYGIEKFYLSVNYKSEMIKGHFKQINKNYNISYFKEDKPLGTAGSLFLLKDKIKSSFFISNCDILIEQDYAEVYNYHRKNKNELTIIGALKNYTIPYGTLETSKDGILEKLQEKPAFNFKVNTGMYILEPYLLDEIPENTFFHITDLIEKIMKRKGKIGVFPVSEGAWLDTGNWAEYNETLKKMGEKPFML